MIVVPKNNVIALTSVASELFIDCAIVSTSFVTLDKISPVLVASKYLSGNLLIFLDIAVLNLFANLFETSVIDIDSI